MREVCKRGHSLKETRYFTKAGKAKGCYQCLLIVGKERYQKKGQEIRERQRHWAKYINPESYKRSKWKDHLKQSYGITPEIWNKLYAEQKGRCASCGIVPAKRLHVDHNHQTGEVRALLCNACNAAVGHLFESPERAEKILRYIRRFSPASTC